MAEWYDDFSTITIAGNSFNPTLTPLNNFP